MSVSLLFSTSPAYMSTSVWEYPNTSTSYVGGQIELRPSIKMSGKVSLLQVTAEAIHLVVSLTYLLGDFVPFEIDRGAHDDGLRRFSLR